MNVMSTFTKHRGLVRWVTILVLAALLGSSGLTPTWARNGTGADFVAHNPVVSDVWMFLFQSPITPTITSTATPTDTPTATPTITSTATSTGTPTVTPTGVPPTLTPTSTPAPTVTPGPCAYTYVVRFGDTLWSIARRFGTTVQAIVQANGIINPNYIWVGQVLCIPYGTPPPTPSPAVYIVQPGDTLWSIARRFGTTVEAIAWVNGIVNPNYIYVGQRLIIPGGIYPPPGQIVYTVRWGDTLWSIARRFGTTAWAIALANNLWNPNFIYVGQQLVIPV